MAKITVPTSKDIYIEVDGKKLAVVESYRAFTKRESKNIEAFGSENPVATVSGKCTYSLELKKVLIINDSDFDKIDFYNLSNFNLMIVKPDCRIIYSGCEWSDITESGDLSKPCIETVNIIASKRMVL